MTSDLQRIYAEDPEAVRAAGRQLAAIGELLAQGPIAEIEAAAAAALTSYPAWTELDRAVADLEVAATDRARSEATRDATIGIVLAVLRAAAKAATGL